LALRAGIEGTLPKGVRAFEPGKTRYISLVKTHLQHVAIAAAINFARFIDWVDASVRPHAGAPFTRLGGDGMNSPTESFKP
jgi:transposase